ncbi:unnamed protein product, partial [Amoebophrya sp. A25]|eukprot:GSA25T00003629001.1
MESDGNESVLSFATGRSQSWSPSARQDAKRAGCYDTIKHQKAQQGRTPTPKESIKEDNSPTVTKHEDRRDNEDALSTPEKSIISGTTVSTTVSPSRVSPSSASAGSAGRSPEEPEQEEGTFAVVNLKYDVETCQGGRENAPCDPDLGRKGGEDAWETTDWKETRKSGEEARKSTDQASTRAKVRRERDEDYGGSSYGNEADYETIKPRRKRGGRNRRKWKEEEWTQSEWDIWLEEKKRDKKEAKADKSSCKGSGKTKWEIKEVVGKWERKDNTSSKTSSTDREPDLVFASSVTKQRESEAPPARSYLDVARCSTSASGASSSTTTAKETAGLQKRSKRLVWERVPKKDECVLTK